MTTTNFQAPRELERIAAPALIIDRAVVRENIEAALRMIDDPSRLRPHVKTVKMREPIEMALQRGVRNFKCATLAEARLAAECGAEDILIAYPLTGPEPERLIDLIRQFPATTVSTLVESESTSGPLARAAAAARIEIGVWLDVNPGMDRTGAPPDESAAATYLRMSKTPGLVMRGLHHYDGHIRDSDVDLRKANCDASFDKTLKLKTRIEAGGGQVPSICAGGSPTYRIHAERGAVECSPGTIFLWDFGYGDAFPDLPFRSAAQVMSRIISRPTAQTLCLGLGHKAVAAENPHPRVRLIGLENAEALGQSEEHLTVRVPNAEERSIGAAILGIPLHICPTVALYERATIVENGEIVGSWRVWARDRDYGWANP